MREPYLMLSNKEYMILTSSVFLWNIVLLFIIKNDYQRAVKDFKVDIVQSLSQLSAAFI